MLYDYPSTGKGAPLDPPPIHTRCCDLSSGMASLNFYTENIFNVSSAGAAAPESLFLNKGVYVRMH